MESSLERWRARWRRLRHPALLRLVQGITPQSTQWGFDRGTPVDRYYIESFLRTHRLDIHGRVLEIQNNAYTERYGIEVTQSHVLDVDARNPRATIVADLMEANSVPENAIDCVILTQTLQFMDDPRVAVANLYRCLSPGGVLLATMPGISAIDGALANVDYWRFTAASAQQVFGACFGARNVSLRAYGNVLTAMAFLTGMAKQELARRELDAYDERFPVIIAVRAVKMR